MVLPICIHSYDDGTEVAPTCNEAGGMLYTCAICGLELMDASIDALGHNYDENGACTVCGSAGTLKINMSSAWAGTWYDGGIEVYADGELIHTVEMGYTTFETWTYELIPNVEYELYWSRFKYADSCSFEILIDDAVVFSAVLCEGSCREKRRNGLRRFGRLRRVAEVAMLAILVYR